MASSADILQQINAIDAQLAPLVADQGKAPGFFKEGINKAFNYNLPLLKEGAALEAGAYTLPQELIDQYNADFGSVFGGASAGARINSILGRLGNQFGLVDLASRLADQQGARMEQMAGDLTNQYGLSIQGLKDRASMKMPLFQTLRSSEDQAANRATQAGIAAANRRHQRDMARTDAYNLQRFAQNKNTIENIGKSVKSTPNWVDMQNNAPSGKVVNPKYANQSLNLNYTPADYYIDSNQNSSPTSFFNLRPGLNFLN